MQRDLGGQGGEVHAEARELLGFWFAGLMDEQRFGKSDGLDEELRRRFGGMRERVLAEDAAGWREDAETLLAAIILIDQVSRNVHRGSGAAFAGDALAQELTLLMIERGWDLELTPEQLQFAYLPLMHAECRELQALSVEKFTELGDPSPLAFARDHAAVIGRFGRFPSRNAALGRESTPEEREYLTQPGVGW